MVYNAGEAGSALLCTTQHVRLLLTLGEYVLAIANEAGGTSHPDSAATMAVCSAYDDAHFNFNLVITIVLKYLVEHFLENKK